MVLTVPRIVPVMVLSIFELESLQDRHVVMIPAALFVASRITLAQTCTLGSEDTCPRVLGAQTCTGIARNIWGAQFRSFKSAIQNSMT